MKCTRIRGSDVIEGDLTQTETIPPRNFKWQNEANWEPFKEADGYRIKRKVINGWNNETITFSFSLSLLIIISFAGWVSYLYKIGKVKILIENNLPCTVETGE